MEAEYEGLSLREERCDRGAYRRYACHLPIEPFSFRLQEQRVRSPTVVATGVPVKRVDDERDKVLVEVQLRRAESEYVCHARTRARRGQNESWLKNSTFIVHNSGVSRRTRIPSKYVTTVREHT